MSNLPSSQKDSVGSESSGQSGVSLKQLLVCAAWACAAMLALVFAGYAPPNLYQGF